MISEKLQTIATGVNKSLHFLLTEEEMNKKFQHVFTFIKELGVTHLEDVSLHFLNEDGLETVRIEDQNLDFFIEKNGDNFILFFQKEDLPRVRIESIEHFSEFNYFLTIFESFLYELPRLEGVEEEKENMAMYAIQTSVGYSFDDLFAQEEGSILSNYQKVVSKNVFTKRIQVHRKEHSISVENLFKDIAPDFQPSQKSLEEMNESSMRDTFLIKRENDTLVLVVYANEDDADFGKEVKLELYCTSDTDNNFPTLELLFSDFNNYKCRPMFSYYYTVRNRGEGLQTQRYSDTDKAIHYWSQLEGFFTEWDKLKKEFNLQ